MVRAADAGVFIQMNRSADRAGGNLFSRRRLVRLLQMFDIFVYEIGTSVFVPLSEIRDKLGPLWASLRANDRQEDPEVD